ncbi:N utilization substance protein B [Legionella geestiana]|uniref:Transcription antitermination protein NusB n=1 Tax=Legionella geestiana TaxID=45065 RepID=A0A0W0TVI8_9GAMM|nr:transcription antitermination factor NusB [Legionella geestiana]KTC99703.1 N utilization substance protein B [Legionella geestiana]QBS13174.1 transcription antitermination factor NusB [Legionella geestiana]QDQ39144.1 transcription antitermination factor NusB [Legionella geestiana]STX54306.1 N utilization substance protein B [Legionella geestiana]
MDKEAIRGRRRARRLALQALYQWQLSGTDRHELEAQFRAMNNMARVDADYFSKILQGVINDREGIDEKLTPLLDRALSELTPVERTVLWLGSFELAECPEVPWRVVLDEAIALTREFGTEDGHRYVNGVLHNLAQTLRAIEIRAENG